MDTKHEFSQWPGNFKYSPLCQDRIVYCGQFDVYEQASELLHELSGIEVSDSTVQRMCVHYGEKLGSDLYNPEKRQQAVQAACAAPEPEPEQDVLYLQFDGGFIYSDTDWQEVKLGRLFLKSDCQQTDEKGRGNIIAKSEYAASLGHYTHFTSKYSVLIEEAKRPNLPMVFITDGAPWMRKWMDENYGDATQILDFFHVCEHLGSFAGEVVSKTRKKHRLWYERQKADLKAGKVKSVIKRIGQFPVKSNSDKVKRKQLVKYLEDNTYRMKYDEYLSAGYMIGSGPIEAAHRTVVQKRMKLSGQRWSDEGAQPMLNLRCAVKSGRRQMIRSLINQAA